jgi:hypothetical protein
MILGMGIIIVRDENIIDLKYYLHSIVIFFYLTEQNINVINPNLQLINPENIK